MIPNAKLVFEIGGAVITVALGYYLQYRAKQRRHAEPVDLACRQGEGVVAMAKMKAILVAVDGSETSDRAVRHALDLLSAGLAAELHLLNVQPNLGGAISTFVVAEQIDAPSSRGGQQGAGLGGRARQEGVGAGQGPYRRRPPGRDRQRLRREARRRPGGSRHARPYRPRRCPAGLGRPGRDRPRQRTGHPVK